MRKLALTQVGEKPGVKFESARDAREFLGFLRSRTVAAEAPGGPSNVVVVPELNMLQTQKLVQEWNRYGSGPGNGVAGAAVGVA